MSSSALTFSHDQAEAHDRIAEMLRAAGVDLDSGQLTPPREGGSGVMAVVGKAGSGKTLLLAALFLAALFLLLATLLCLAALLRLAALLLLPAMALDCCLLVAC